MGVRSAAMLTVLVGCAFDHGVAGGGDADGGQDATPGGVIAFDTETSASTLNSATLTWSHSVGSGLKRSLLLVGVSVEKTSGASVQTITYGGASLTRAAAATGGAGVKAELWYLRSPAAGAGTVTVNFTQTLGSDGAVGGAISLSGVDQTTPAPTTSTNGGNGMPSTQITTVNNRAWIVDVIMVDNNSAVTPSDAGHQARWNTTQGSQICGAAGTLVTTSPGTATPSWTSTSDNWAQVVAEIKP